MALSQAWSPWGQGNLNRGGTSRAGRSSGPKSKSKFPEYTCFDYLLEGRITEDAMTNRRLKQQVSLYEEIGTQREEAWRLSRSNRYAEPVKKRKLAKAYEKILIKVQEAKAFYTELLRQWGMDPIRVPGHLADPLPV